MKPFIISTGILLTAAMLLLTASCKKTEIKELEKAGSRLRGTWKVNEINVRTTDTAGNLLTTSSLPNQGSITFAAGDQSKTGADVFDHADFTGPCANSDLVLYFRNIDAGTQLADGWSLEYDADPDDLRVQFWGIAADGSYHISTNHTYTSAGQDIFYVVQSANTNKRIFYTWKLSK